MKTEGSAVRRLFPVLEILLPSLLVVKCLIPSAMPGYVAYIALAFFALILAVRFFWKERLGDVLRITLYFMIPVVLYLGSASPERWYTAGAARIINGVFIVVALLDIAVSKMSLRRDGFKSTPLDFLVVLLAVLVPNLPDLDLRQYNLGLVGAKIIILYFSFEVLLAEVRMRYDRVMVGTLAALAVLIVKGVF